MQEEPRTKSRPNAFYFLGPIFDAEKILAQAIVHQKKNAHLEVRKEGHAQEDCTFQKQRVRR